MKTQEKLFQELKEALQVDSFSNETESVAEQGQTIYIVLGVISYEDRTPLRAFKNQLDASEFVKKIYEVGWDIAKNDFSDDKSNQIDYDDYEIVDVELF